MEVTGERTKRATVYANPDGYTFMLEESAVPVRVAKPVGGWEASDATLEERSDGSMGPRRPPPTALLDCFPGLELDLPPGGPSWRPSMRARGLLNLPVHY
ncbi:cytochrome P450 [Streptomyces guryensis]|uniref:Cytochrome P450 n=1 Tax=Streptomyces guryensis TaxID=2886947 RepID=A0A9Q3Z595_9ACTN|nr:cytochrome P450 [Streptomyces guryensis]MCD9875426.1 cytochrome P450 [Streptomyces guryensis]